MSGQQSEQSAGTAPEERADRLKKLARARDAGMSGYEDSFERSHTVAEARELAEQTETTIAGRLMRYRNMGKMVFGDVLDQSGSIQIVLRIGDDSVSKEVFDTLVDVLSVGDIVGVRGNRFTTNKGEVSVLVRELTLLTKALRPLPDKWHGLKDVEQKYRKRYLDLITDEETRERFLFRSRFVAALRAFYAARGFMEVETPVLAVGASGALAQPFTTHYNALDLDVNLRIAPELYLKQAVIGGFERVFEIGKVFRNEGMDASHLQEFTTVEHYAAYWDYHDNMRFTEELFGTLLTELLGTTEVTMLNRTHEEVMVDFKPPYPVVTFRELIKQDCGINIAEHTTADALRSAIADAGITLEHADTLGRGNLIDALYKKVSRPKLVRPTFLTEHPIDLSPLARPNNENPAVADRFQLVTNGWEIVNAYSELGDPLLQEESFQQQAVAQAHGDAEAMSKDAAFVTSLEYGMPPTSGWAIGIDRIVALLTKQPNLRDVVLFPLLRPE